MKKLLTILFITLFTLSGCNQADSNEDKVIKVAATSSPAAEILEAAREDVEKEGYTLEIIEFDDFITPNTSLSNDEVDANLFQHQPFLAQYNEDNDETLQAVGSVHFIPIGLYSNDTTQPNAKFSIDDINENAQIAVPDDPTNEARALQLLASIGIIELKADAGLNATIADIVENPKNVSIVEIKAENIPSVLEDVDYAVVNGNYALSSKISEKAIILESADSDAAKRNAVVLATKQDNVNSDKSKVLIKALQSDKVKNYINDTYNNLVIPVFDAVD